MLAAIEKINLLQMASGPIQKMKIMREHQEDEDFRKLLYYALNPRLTYKVSEHTLSTPATYDPAITLTMCDIYDICEMLSKRKALDDATVYQVRSFLGLCEPAETAFYKKLLSKTLRLGVTAKTVNKVMPGLIPEWEVQQSYPIDKYPLKDGMWFTLTEKLNGVRATYYKGQLFARSGVPYEGLEHITSLFEWTQDAVVFDGELTLMDKGGLSDNEAFRMATGIINSDGADKTAICYTIFDCLPTSEFEAGQSAALYEERRTALDAMAVKFNQSRIVSVLPVLYSGTDQSQIDELLDQMVREDKEGLMVNLNAPYRCKRHNGILKVKRFYTMDLPIIGWEQGSGRLANTLGAFVLDYKGGEVKVGSGFTDEQRVEFWEKRESLIGTICEVKYKEISSDKGTGAESLQFPVFISLRPDKEDVNYG